MKEAEGLVRLVHRVVVGLSMAAASPGHASPPSEGRPAALVIEGATLVVPDGGELRADVRVVIVGDRIRCVGPRDECAAPSGGRIVDGRGRYVLPGLFDAHVHTSQRLPQVAPLYLAFGITSVRDAGGFPDFTRSLQDDIAAGALLGPRIYTAGRPIDGEPSAWPIPGIARTVRTDEEARAAVRASLAEGADFIKLYTALPRDLVRAAVDEAHAIGAKVTIDYVLRGPEVVDTGIDGVEHVLPPPAMAKDLVQRYAAVGGAVPVAQTLRRMQERGTALTTTLVLMERIATGGLAEDEATFAALPESLRARSAEMLAGMDGQAAAFMRAMQGYACDQVKTFVAIGGTILAGTDSYFLSSYPGDLHRELELLVRCGMTPAQALVAGTAAPARWLGLRDVGVVEPGARADLLLLRANPLRDISATREIEWVVKDGHLHAPGAVLRTVR
jgi:imidazolonepropionase-like amidohydrolase